MSGHEVVTCPKCDGLGLIEVLTFMAWPSTELATTTTECPRCCGAKVVVLGPHEKRGVV
jgi:DnaJ-class molecular chaperone